MLTFEAPPSYGAQERYEVTLRAAADGELGVQAGTLDVTVTVTDVDEPADISFAAAGGVLVYPKGRCTNRNRHSGASKTGAITSENCSLSPIASP